MTIDEIKKIIQNGKIHILSSNADVLIEAWTAKEQFKLRTVCYVCFIQRIYNKHTGYIKILDKVGENV